MLTLPRPLWNLYRQSRLYQALETVVSFKTGSSRFYSNKIRLSDQSGRKNPHRSHSFLMLFFLFCRIFSKKNETVNTDKQNICNEIIKNLKPITSTTTQTKKRDRRSSGFCTGLQTVPLIFVSEFEIYFVINGKRCCSDVRHRSAH